MRGYDVPSSSQDLFETFLDIAGPLDMSMEEPRPRPRSEHPPSDPPRRWMYTLYHRKASRGNWKTSSTSTSTNSNTRTREQLFASSCQAAYSLCRLHPQISPSRCGSVSARTRMYFRRLMMSGSFWACPCVVKRIQGVIELLSNVSLSTSFDVV
ncbi:hypothetical protein E2C01_065600 [Portunus trituberculatus]|uniref:Uncharacterized protein n=1 Tax=Portunus trituberculatus TaxID=210409 RepID=A0A5B7HMA8_PORTR|nr:hypothetical protein [Portunus trituberculatus]